MFRSPINSKSLWLVVVCGLLASTGCNSVQRRMIIRSQPEGAFVSVDRQPIGYTPVSVPWTYNGTREIQLEKDGFQTVKVQQNMPPTWYEAFPVSLVTENFWPNELRDERVLDFQLQPRQMVNENLLIDRANQMRNGVTNGTLNSPN